MKKLLTTTAFAALLSMGLTGMASAQTTPVDPPVPAPVAAAPSTVSPNGVNQVDQRLQNQQNRIDNGVKDGQINAKQEMRDDKTDAHVAKEMSKDEAKNGGAITTGEQAKMNRQLNKDSKRIHHQKVKATKAAPVTTAPVSQ